MLYVLDSTAATDTVTTEAGTNEPSVEVAIARNSGDAVTPTNVADDPSNTTTDNPNDFDALEPEAESDDGASDSTNEYTPDENVGVEEEEENLEEPMFDKALLDSMGGIAKIASGTSHGDILKNMGVSGWSKPVSYSSFPYLDEPYDGRPIESLRKDYPQRFNGQFGPTSRALEAATTPSGALFYFVRPQLWEDIAGESNDFFEEKLDERVEGQYSKQVLREQKKPGFTRSTREDFATPVITARELCNFVGLLIARTISPNKEKLEHLWKTVSDRAIARGLFGYFMKRDRFMHISRNLHFSSNSDQRAKSDRAWKLRPLIDSLQATFQSGYKPPPVMSFDEAMLPSRSSFNRMRVYLKDKPHKWGTSTKLTHVKFLKQLHLEFIQLQEMQATPTNAEILPGRVRTFLSKLMSGERGRKKRQRACKVCSVLKESSEAKGGETTFYCSTCKLQSNSMKATVTRVYLCNKSVSCFKIWLRHWRNGSMLPPSQRKKKIQARTTELSVDEETKLGSDSDGGDGVDNQSKRRRRDE
ncbi:LOW QUALITY PROTEIN: hypothetical protein PHPALM_30617 [Phytophthora palmivora]|uniref:PiggyBac transposable element-derived protein domain-containing protein n=1 Tax=Phytophthora palmivora TaxID=4796 RepID=A0A2P4X4P0_9STRA|nr:LOW QUALITY PROTEIN: hypothetical protein PHPALM_30617 [Phytophthora palmivora]